MSKTPARAVRGRNGAVRLAAVAVAASAAVAGCGAVENQAAGEAAGAPGCDRSASFPAGPIELIVPWEAGGGTDSVARFLSTQLAKELDTQVNVVNRTGGSGVVGHAAIASAPADGSTIGLATVEITMMHWQGLTDLDQEELAPVAQVNADPAAITVRADAPYDDVQDLVAAAQKDPGALTASGTGRGGIWDLARAGMLIEAGADPRSIRWVPSDGAAPALQELVAGGIDVSFASLVENQTMLKAGRVKALGVMSDERDPRFPDVPTLKEQGVDFEMSAWRGVAGPAGMPEDVVAELSCTLDAIVHGDAYTSFMKKTGFGVEWRGSTEFARFMQRQDTDKGQIMETAGLTS